ncbi:hypothetical protein GAFPHCNK_16045 [[Clostridium] scindens]|uniref:hypothetical protein n=1 Tax=Clostridium scindens (strain JCM 10418 / VPI 12708) TaxID=29347 RepID=UPI0034C5D756
MTVRGSSAGSRKIGKTPSRERANTRDTPQEWGSRRDAAMRITAVRQNGERKQKILSNVITGGTTK